MPKGRKAEQADYFVVAVRRDYEPIWRFISKHTTREEAQAELDKRRSFTGAFNYDNAELRVLSRSEGKKEFGAEWEYKAIGGDKADEKPAPKRKPAKNDDY
jgi:hypothetical protein